MRGNSTHLFVSTLGLAAVRNLDPILILLAIDPHVLQIILTGDGAIRNKS